MFFSLCILCFRDGGASWLETIFQEWTDEGMVLRLDIRHWLHRWDSVVIKQSHMKYPAFMGAMAGAILAYYDEDLTKLINARRKDDARYATLSDDQMISHLKAHDFKTYVRRLTRGVEVSGFIFIRRIINWNLVDHLSCSCIINNLSAD